MNTIPYWLRLSIQIVLSFVFFVFLGGFNYRQSSVLVVMWVLVWDAFQTKEYPFRPFVIRIEPHWQRLLRDNNVFATEEELNEWWERSRSLERQEWRRFTFTFVSPSLVFWHEYKEFQASARFAHRVSGLEQEDNFVGLRLDYHDKGYGLFLTTPNTQETFADSPGKDDILVSVIPFEVMEYLRYCRKRRSGAGIRQEIQRVNNAMLENGWKGSEHIFGSFDDGRTNVYFGRVHEESLTTRSDWSSGY